MAYPRGAAVRALFAFAVGLMLLGQPTLADSGGYRRPAVSSFTGSSFPGYGSSSGAYRRPSTSSYGGYATGSAGDLAVSRGASGQALGQFRGSQTPRRPSTSGGYGSGAYGGWASDYERRPAPPGYAPSGGGFGSAAFWAFLGALSASDRSAYFRQSQADPAFQQWQQQALRDPDTAARLRSLGGSSAQAQVGGTPQSSTSSGGSSGFGWFILFLAIGAFVLLWFLRRRAEAGGTSGVPAGLSGSKAMRFRVGQTIPLDPAPFVLAMGVTKVQPPPAGKMISVEAVALLEDAGTRLHRLYLPGLSAFFQLHLGGNGMADECRYFSKLDEVQPADEREWGEWLDPAQGMIGWPAFQTKDGKTYGRVWAAGERKVTPRQQTETLQDLRGTSQRNIQAMLYGGPTGAALPAPQNELILVSAVESSGQAWVEIHAGIDINPAALTLPPVSL
jgi:MYXO-CTERM domain-containing protein